MSSQHSGQPLTVRPDPTLKANAQSALSDRSRDMQGFVVACLTALVADPGTFLTALDEHWPKKKAVGRPRKTATEGRRIVTVKGKRYVVSAIHPARPRIPEAYVAYWSERNGERFGATRSASASCKPGTVGRAIWDALSR